MSLDISNGERTTIGKTDVPHDVVDLNVSSNLIEKLPEDIFNENTKLWRLNLSNNKLKSLSFARSFTSLGLLDLRNNNLAIDDFLDIFHMYILHIKLEGNEFYSKMTNLLLLPALLTQVWIIDGVFVTDYTRKMAKEYRESIAFGEEILALRRDQMKTSKQAGVNNAAQIFLNGLSVKFGEPGAFISRDGILLKNNNDLPQINRLKLLMTYFPIDLPEGSFSEYFGIAAGILSYFWLQIPMDYIPRIVCGNYWLMIVKSIEKMEQYQILLILFRISSLIIPTDDIEKSLWDCLGVPYFLQTGEIPRLGSTPRLVLQAFIERSPDVSDSEDRILYLKLRLSANFTTSTNFCTNNNNNTNINMSACADFTTIYNEILGPLLVVARDCPKKEDPIAIRHPFMGSWVNGTVASCKNGRVYIRLENFIVQLPVLSVFWDGRGIWREALPAADPVITAPTADITANATDGATTTTATATTTKEGGGQKGQTQIRAKSEMIGQLEENKYRVGFFDPLSTFSKTKAGTTGVGRNTSSTKYMTTTPFQTQRERERERTQKGRAKSQLTPTFLTDEVDQKLDTIMNTTTSSTTMSVVFDSMRPERKPVVKNAPSRRPNQYIQDVVNITFGVEIGGGRKLRKFNVRTENPLTHKTQYIWVSEDEIPPEDVRRLIDLFRKHIESKMTIIPGL